MNVLVTKREAITHTTEVSHPRRGSDGAVAAGEAKATGITESVSLEGFSRPLGVRKTKTFQKSKLRRI